MEEEEATDERLGCLLDVLGRRRREPDRDGRLAVGMAGRVVLPFWEPAPWAFSGILLSFKPWLSRMLPSPVGQGNCVSLNSVDADSRLLWRSSKLTEGKKSKELVDSPN